MIVSGSIGGRFLFKITDVICKKYDKPLNLLVMCGKDKKIYEKIKKYKNYNKNINIMYFGYTDRFDEFIAASDCVIARASAGIFIESILNKTPEITFRRVTSNDRGAITMIEKYGLGEVCDDDSEIIDKLNKILQNKEMYKNNIDRLLLRYSNTYEEKKNLIRSIIIEGNSSAVDDGEIESEPLSETLV